MRARGPLCTLDVLDTEVFRQNGDAVCDAEGAAMLDRLSVQTFLAEELMSSKLARDMLNSPVKGPQTLTFPRYFSNSGFGCKGTENVSQPDSSGTRSRVGHRAVM